jgi:hypothetical protein
VAWNRTTYQYVVFLREHLNDLQTFHLHAVRTHTAGHAHSFEYTAGVRGTTDRTGSALTVVLTVRSFTHTRETMALNYTLETLTFCGTYHLNFLAFSENVYRDGVSDILFLGIVSEFFYCFLGRSVGLSEVILFSSGSVLFFLVAECDLQGIVAMPSVSCVFTWVTTQGPASMMVQAVCLPLGSKMLVIPIFFPMIPFITYGFSPARLCKTDPWNIGSSILVHHRPFLLSAVALA